MTLDPDASRRLNGGKLTKFQIMARDLCRYRFVCLIAIAVASVASAQGSPQAQTPQTQTARAQILIAPATSLVLVPALVRSPFGDLVANLHADDFQVTDNGQQQQVRLDVMDMEHISLAVVMQTGGGTPAQLQNYRTLTRLVANMFGTAIPRVALVTFDSHVEEIWNFPPRLDGVKHAFRGPDAGDQGAAIIDGLHCAAGLLEAQPADFRRVILLLSQAADQGSQTMPAVLVRELGEDNITVYSVAFKPSVSHRTRKPGRPSNNLVAIPTEAKYAATELDLIAARLRTETSAESAELTGGEHVDLKDIDELSSVLSTLRNDFANTYLLTFQPKSSLPGFHAIQVQLRRPLSKNTLATRQAYWRGSD